MCIKSSLKEKGPGVALSEVEGDEVHMLRMGAGFSCSQQVLLSGSIPPVAWSCIWGVRVTFCIRASGIIQK